MITNINQLDLNRRYSYADYLTWQFQDRVELIKGLVMEMSPAPVDRHQMVSQQLTREISNYFKRKSCQLRVAPYDVRLQDSRKSIYDKDIFTVVQPDLCLICDISKIDYRGCLGSPDWIIEIVSPGNPKRDIQEKYYLYEENGVKEYWIVHPVDNTVMVFSLQNDKFQLVKIYAEGDKIPTVLFPDLIIDSTDIF